MISPRRYVVTVLVSVLCVVAGCGGGDSAPATQPPGATAYALAVTVAGSGSVSSAPAGISCAADCSETYASGTSVTLTATAANGFRLESWGSACSGSSATCTVSMTSARSVSANFVQVPAPPAAPMGLSAIPGNAQVALSWNAASGATGYKVYRGTTVIATQAATTFTDTAVSNGTSYSYQVSATNDSGEGAKSSAIMATPTSTGAQTHCEPQPSACGYPDATNTGVPQNTALIPHSGNLTISTADAVVERMDINGCVEVTAPGVTIRNSKVTCSGFYAIRTIGGAAANGAARLVIENVDLVLGDNTTGIAAQNITIRRLRSHGGENAGSFSKDVTIEDSFITDIKEVNGGHGDGLQFSAPVANIVLNHNTILGYSVVNGATVFVTSAVNWTGEQGTASMTVQNNLLAGGGWTLYCPRVAVASGAFQVLNNRFGIFGLGHTDSCGNTGQVVSGNYSDADLGAIPR